MSEYRFCLLSISHPRFGVGFPMFFSHPVRVTYFLVLPGYSYFLHVHRDFTLQRRSGTTSSLNTGATSLMDRPDADGETEWKTRWVYHSFTTAYTGKSSLPLTSPQGLRRLLQGLRNCDNNKAPSREPEDDETELTIQLLSLSAKTSKLM